MKRIREALRLHEKCKISKRKIAKAIGVSRPVINSYIDKCQENNISYQIACSMTDEELQKVLFQDKSQDPRKKVLNEIFPKHEKELSRVGVTRQILWEEYKAEYSDGYSYSQYCYYLQQWNKSKEVFMRINHKAGDKLYVDYTGKKLETVNPQTGEITAVEVFVATLGASKIIYAEATYTQQKHDFINAQINTLKYLGGVPAAIVPDCLKSAVTKGHRYEPEINPEYQEFASHYETAMLPARPYHPKDKALVEGSVRIVYQNIFAPLRDKHFFSIESLNSAIKEQLEILNNKIMKDYSVSRWQLFNEIEKDVLKPLPVNHFQVRNHKRLKVYPDYHIFIKSINHHFSVPYKYCGMHVDAYYTTSSVEIYHNNTRIALHIRKRSNNLFTTEREHMPAHHQFMEGWTPEKFISWGESYGESVKELVETVFITREHPEQGYKTSLGILNLAKEFGKERLNKACAKALKYNSLTYRFIKNILENKQEENFYEEENKATPEHENIRGSQYYETQEEL